METFSNTFTNNLKEFLKYKMNFKLTLIAYFTFLSDYDLLNLCLLDTVRLTISLNLLK